jgi:ribose transport system ATP-binding protein
MSTPSTGPVLELADISKSFPGVKALDRVSLTLCGGEVQALLGENGAGKSTLIKIIAGVIPPDAGTLRLWGEPRRFSHPRQAFVAGINVVHQERNLVPTFTVGENIMLERIAARALGPVNLESLYREAEEFLDMVGLNLSPRAPIENLSAGKQQMIEIARALSSHARILLLDEPTASISLNEARTLFETVHKLQEQGVAFIFVSHKLEEIFQVATRITVLRDGKNAGPPSRPLAELTRDELVTLMVGRSEVVRAFPVRDLHDRSPVLEVNGLKGQHSYRPATFTLHKGEILGWYGLVGAGRTELARVLIGADPATAGDVRVKGAPARITSVAQALHQWHIGYLTENRQEEGLFLTHPIVRNIAATVWDRLRSGVLFVDPRREQQLAENYRQRLAIRTSSVAQLVSTLSGGNRQKVSIAKGLAANPELLIFDEPTVGIDVKTKAEIHELIWALAEEGISIILISSDMPEVIRLADRILVFREGQICADLPNTKNYDEMSHRIIGLIVSDAATPSTFQPAQ